MKVLRGTDREISAKVETESENTKIFRQLLLLHTRYPYTKYEVSSSSGSNVMIKSPKPEVELFFLIFFPILWPTLYLRTKYEGSMSN